MLQSIGRDISNDPTMIGYRPSTQMTSAAPAKLILSARMSVSVGSLHATRLSHLQPIQIVNFRMLQAGYPCFPPPLER